MTKCTHCKSPLEWDAETRRYTPLADQMVVALGFLTGPCEYYTDSDCWEEGRSPGHKSASMGVCPSCVARLILEKVQESQDDN